MPNEKAYISNKKKQKYRVKEEEEELFWNLNVLRIPTAESGLEHYLLF